MVSRPGHICGAGGDAEGFEDGISPTGGGPGELPGDVGRVARGLKSINHEELPGAVGRVARGLKSINH